MNFIKLGLIVGAAAVLAGEAAKADTITIAYSTDSGATITSLASGSGSAAFNGPIAGTSFDSNNISGTGSPPLALPALLGSNAFDLSSTTAGTIWVYVTESGITTPTGTEPFTSSLTSNTLTGTGTSLTMETLFNSGNLVAGVDSTWAATAIAMGGPVTFTSGPLTSVLSSNIATGAGPYSVTALFEVTTTGNGSANATINVAVPGPVVGAGLPGLLAACGSLIALARRRRQKLA